MGRLEEAVLSLFTKRAAVTELRRVNEKFTVVTLHGDELRGVVWAPGQKVQVQLGGFTQRTFTPMSWDRENGATALLVYDHGDGPVSKWMSALAVGATCALFGPRSSLDLNALERPGLVFGDETSFGLAHALRFTLRGTTDVELLFEVTSLRSAEQALEAVGITGAELVERRTGDAHVGALEEAAESAFRKRSIRSATLSGKAASIQKLNARLKSLGLNRRQIRAKAYWAPGKKGLD